MPLVTQSKTYSFTAFDRELEGELRSGLDDVKIYVEKFFAGRDSLVSVLREMKGRFSSSLEIPDPGDFRKKHKEFRSHSNVDTSRTLWLIKDSSIDSKSARKGSEVYFSCYDQNFINETDFHIFDENKPAWISHTTIPHTLVSAMINITKPTWLTLRPVILCDPFVGTGTTLLEALKHVDVECRCSDLAPIAPLLVQDNAEVFAKEVPELKKLAADLSPSVLLGI